MLSTMSPRKLARVEVQGAWHSKLLESAVATIRAEVEALSKPVHVWHPAEGEWSINEIIGHLIEAERRGFAGRIKILLATKDPQLEGC